MAFKKREQVMESDSEEEGRRYDSEEEEQSVNIRNALETIQYLTI